MCNKTVTKMSVLCPFYVRFVSFSCPHYVLVEQEIPCYNWNRRKQQKRNAALLKKFFIAYHLKSEPVHRQGWG